MVGELLFKILLNKTGQSKSTKMYFVLCTKILQGAGTTSGARLLKRCSIICG